MGSIQSVFIRFLLRRSNIWNKPLDEIRKTLEGIKPGKGIGNILMEKAGINGVGCETFLHPVKKNDKVILYFHGGGFCLGIYNTNREFVARLAVKTEADVYMPDYRLAPENPFPAALEDAISVYKGLIDKGYKAKDIILMGDSSGCALALSSMLVLKQSGCEMPAAIVFITPVVDLAGNGETFTTKAGKDPFRLSDPLRVAKIYVKENNPASPMLSPLYGEMDGLPPMLVHVAENDVFLSDSCRLADKARIAGVQMEMKIWRKMWHIFHMQAPFVPESRKALNEIASFVLKSGII